MNPIDNKSGYWTKEKCQDVALECKNREQFKKKYKSAYNSSYKNNWLDEICSHMQYESHVTNNYWTKDKKNTLSSAGKGKVILKKKKN